ncbi:MAG: uncharacterized protein KVP18_003878 [Porospora cf. gigantea A]|uniref:uncharacterized protein n=1 Tax=Porospora cf. gigantea A TaxID=2853593 RepID=UPI00355A3A7C|nr:MAG: hypothetical protein KVP18_003878 [Porospora cf. gigantea A]
MSENLGLVSEADFYGIKFFPYPLCFSLGGFDGVAHLSSMEVLDVALQQWKPASPLEIERTYFGAENLKGQIVVTGGFNLDYKALYSTEVRIVRDHIPDL